MIEIRTEGRGKIEARLHHIDRSMKGARDDAALRSATLIKRTIERWIKSLLNKRATGALARSWKISKTKSGAEVVSDSPYAGIHDRGGTIRARRRKYLTIPLTDSKRTARGWAGLFPIRSKKGNLLLVLRKGNRVDPKFLLRKQVKIHATGYLKSAAKEWRSTLKALAQTIARRISR